MKSSLQCHGIESYGRLFSAHSESPEQWTSHGILGYGDLASIGQDCYLAFYYLSDEDGRPWIEGSVFYLK